MITKDQLIQFEAWVEMIVSDHKECDPYQVALEQYEKNKWIKFNGNEPITWPNKVGSYWTNNGMLTWVDYRNIGCDAFFTNGAQSMENLNYLVDYYQELPEIEQGILK